MLTDATQGQDLCLSDVLHQAEHQVDQIVDGYTCAYKEIFAHTEGVLQRSIDTGNSGAATVALLQMYNALDTSWREIDNKLHQTRYTSSNNNSDIGRMVELLSQNAVVQPTSIQEKTDVVDQPHNLSHLDKLRGCLQEQVTSLVEKYHNRGKSAFKKAVDQVPARQRRLIETTLFQSVFCPDVSNMGDFHHPNSTVYDTSLDHSWSKDLIPIMQNITFFATTILRELTHDENTHETHMLFTVLHLMQRMGFWTEDISHLALRIDTLFYRSIISDTQFHFIAQNSPNLYTFPGDNLYNIMCVFVDSGCCTLFANSSATTNKKRAEWWQTKYVRTQAERALSDIRKDTDKGIIQYSILHGLQHLRNSTFEKLNRVSTLQHIILGSPLPYAKMVLEVQQLFLSGLAQIPEFGPTLISYVDSNSCFRVRGWPLVLRQHYVMFIKTALWQLRCIPTTPAVFWASGVLTPLHCESDVVDALVSWYNSNPFNAKKPITQDDLVTLLGTRLKKWVQYIPRQRAWRWEVEESEVQKAVSLRLGANDTLRDHESLVANLAHVMCALLRVHEAASEKPQDDTRQHHYGFNAAEIISNLSEAKCNAEHRQKAATQLNDILKDFDIKQSTLNFCMGVGSLRPQSVFGKPQNEQGSI